MPRRRAPRLVEGSLLALALAAAAACGSDGDGGDAGGGDAAAGGEAGATDSSSGGSSAEGGSPGGGESGQGGGAGSPEPGSGGGSATGGTDSGDAGAGGGSEAPGCEVGTSKACYTGDPETLGTGPCHAGTRTCGEDGTFGACEGQVLPGAPGCPGEDLDCDGNDDFQPDEDGDGYSACDDCCDTEGLCEHPEAVNPGAFEVADNDVDDDCNDEVDEAATSCDSGLASNTSDAVDFARAIDLCATTTQQSSGWGVLGATLRLASGGGEPGTVQHAIRSAFGSGLSPLVGSSFAVLSTGAAAAPGQVNPSFVDFQDAYDAGTESAFPADWYSANGQDVPSAPGCPEPEGTTANDSVMLTLALRVPTNARAFSVRAFFLSSEFPEWTCSPFNDFFVALIDSVDASNPSDKNFAYYQTPSDAVYPVGVNLAYGNTGLFSACVNGDTGCAGSDAVAGEITSCSGTSQLVGSGFDAADPDHCDAGSLAGGGTGWLELRANVQPGEVATVRFAIWDTSDHTFDSLVLLDGFTWLTESVDPGAVVP